MPETMRELEDEEASRKKEDESTVAAQNNLQTGSRSMKKISTRKRKIFPRKR